MILTTVLGLTIIPFVSLGKTAAEKFESKLCFTGSNRWKPQCLHWKREMYHLRNRRDRFLIPSNNQVPVPLIHLDNSQYLSDRGLTPTDHSLPSQPTLEAVRCCAHPKNRLDRFQGLGYEIHLLTLRIFLPDFIT